MRRLAALLAAAAAAAAPSAAHAACAAGGPPEPVDVIARPLISVPGRTFRPAGATLDGVTHVQPTTVRVAVRMLTLHSSMPLVGVRDVGGGAGIGAATLWRVPLPGGSSRVVVDTGDRVYAFGVFSKLAHR